MTSLIRERVSEAILNEKKRVVAIIESQPFPPECDDMVGYHITMSDFLVWRERVVALINRRSDGYHV
jgi:hypothetical protein